MWQALPTTEDDERKPAHDIRPTESAPETKPQNSKLTIPEKETCCICVSVYARTHRRKFLVASFNVKPAPTEPL